MVPQRRLDPPDGGRRRVVGDEMPRELGREMAMRRGMVRPGRQAPSAALFAFRERAAEDDLVPWLVRAVTEQEAVRLALDRDRPAGEHGRE